MLVCAFDCRDQAAREVKPEPKPYCWRIGASDALTSRLIAIVEGCLFADPAGRWTVSRVIDALTALRRDVGTGTAAAASSLDGSYVSRDSAALAVSVASAPPGAPVAGSGAGAGDGVTYDVLALLDGLASVGVDDAVVAAVADAIGHLAVTSLAVLNTCGVPGAKSLAVRRLLTRCDDRELVGGLTAFLTACHCVRCECNA